MTMQSQHHDHSLTDTISNSVTAQMTLLLAALIAVTLLAWFFVF
jgi:hypothetical protein